MAALERRGDRHSPSPRPPRTYAAKDLEGETRLDWTRDAATLRNQVRSLNTPGAWTEINGERVKVLKATRSPRAQGAPEPCSTTA